MTRIWNQCDLCGELMDESRARAALDAGEEMACDECLIAGDALRDPNGAAFDLLDDLTPPQRRAIAHLLNNAIMPLALAADVGDLPDDLRDAVGVLRDRVQAIVDPTT